MRSHLSGFVPVLYVCVMGICSAGAAQADNSVSGGGAAASRSGSRAGVFISSGRSSTIRIIGAPRNQPNAGRNVECSPVDRVSPVS